MKHILALLVALLLALLPAMAEPMSYLDYTDDILDDGSLIYYFPELSLKLPADWRGKVMAMAEEGRTAFYQKASYEAYQKEGIEGGGFLFSLGACVNSSFSELPAYRYLGFSEESAMNYYLQLPSDYCAYTDDAVRAEYDAMFAQIDEVVENAHFYGEGEADTGEAAPEEAEAQGEGVSLERMRYHFEHNALPRYFYEDPANMLDVLGEHGLYRLWTALADENAVAYPWVEGDFAQYTYNLDDGTEILQVVMPKPEVSPQCYRVYFVYNANTCSAGYYTIEYENLLGDSAFTCGWMPTGEHMNYGGAAILDPNDAGYAAALEAEAQQIAALAGASGALSSGGADDADGLAEISCPEMGFTTRADPAYRWDYQEGTGITIYTEEAGRIPYVIVWQGEDLLNEPFEYIREQYTPHMQKQYGDALVDYAEFEAYDFGSKQLPAGIYTYKVQDKLVDMIRAYDSTGARTVAYTLKVIRGQEEPTLTALKDAIRNFRAD